MFYKFSKRFISKSFRIDKAFFSLSNNNNNNNNMPKELIWVDCEMTGLNIEQDRLLEIAAIITDDQLVNIDTFGPVCIGQSKDVLDNMSVWCKRQFAKNGLTERCLNSQVTIEEADEMLADFLTKNNIERDGVIAGNSISTDRVFLDKYCKKFVSKLHYRMVDVSSIKILVKMWFNDRTLYNKYTQHRALSDIQQSIDELRFYRENYFIKLGSLEKPLFFQHKIPDD